MILSMSTEERRVLVRTPICFICASRSIVFVSEDEARRMKTESKASVFPHLPLEEIEVLISGIHPECWNSMTSLVDRMYAEYNE